MTAPSLFERLQKLATEVGATKSAADTPGTTTHPTEGVDNGTTTASEGSRSSENTADTKASIGSASVDSTSPNPGGSQDAQQPNVGTTQAATGEDPSSEDAYKDRKDDPGTSHPAQVGQEKYGSLSTAQCIAEFTKQANNLLADIAVSLTGTPATSAPANATTAATAKEASAPTAAPAAELAFLAGYDLAKQAGLSQSDAQAHVAAVVESTIHDALHCADLVSAYLKSAAVDPESAGEESTDNKDIGAGGDSSGGAPSPAPAAPAMGDPAAMGGEPSQEQVLQELLAATAELGITPEQLLELLQSSGGGDPAAAGSAPPMGGGAPPVGGSAPPVDPAATADLAKMAKIAKDWQRTGRWQFTAAKDAAARQLRDELKSFICEAVGV